jgi:hypothetical protein
VGRAAAAVHAAGLPQPATQPARAAVAAAVGALRTRFSREAADAIAGAPFARAAELAVGAARLAARAQTDGVRILAPVTGAADLTGAATGATDADLAAVRQERARGCRVVAPDGAPAAGLARGPTRGAAGRAVAGMAGRLAGQAAAGLARLAARHAGGGGGIAGGASGRAVAAHAAALTDGPTGAAGPAVHAEPCQRAATLARADAYAGQPLLRAAAAGAGVAGTAAPPGRPAGLAGVTCAAGGARLGADGAAAAGLSQAAARPGRRGGVRSHGLGVRLVRGSVGYGCRLRSGAGVTHGRPIGHRGRDVRRRRGWSAVSPIIAGRVAVPAAQQQHRGQQGQHQPTGPECARGDHSQTPSGAQAWGARQLRSAQQI